MIKQLAANAGWLPYHLGRELKRSVPPNRRVQPTHVYFCICDHFEPYWNGADKATARKRITRWLDAYPRLAERYPDSQGKVLKYSFFYPEEEYTEPDLELLAQLCHAGYGEVEIHLHHDNDTPENLRRTLIDFKHRLHEKHGFLRRDPETGQIRYGFIHGNWALNNSRCDGRWCGVSEETDILLETGCYADFTMPSAPSETQTRKVNSIYYAVGDPGRPKSHDWGEDAEVGKRGKGLLMVQGPLALDWGRRKYGVLPRVENSGLMENFPPSAARVRSWVDAGVCVKGAPQHVFVKLYTHGTIEGIMRMLFDAGGFERLFEALHEDARERGYTLRFVSAREMVEVIETLVAGGSDAVR